MTAEDWRPIAGYEKRYEVSSLGRVRRLYTDDGGSRCNHLVLKPAPRGNGYLCVGLHLAGKQRTHSVHRLVASAFMGAPPTGTQCCHIDGDRENNAVSNLRWGTRSSNEADKVRHGRHNRGERHGSSRLTTAQVLSIRKDMRSQCTISAEHGIAQSTVSQIQSRKRWRHV